MQVNFPVAYLLVLYVRFNMKMIDFDKLLLNRLDSPIRV